MIITIAYTGMRWGEAIGLEPEFVLPALINVEWQLRELNGRFHRLPPKDDSYRSTNWEPFIPIDLPPFFAALLVGQATVARGKRCRCAGTHDGRGQYLFTGPDGGHHRRSDYARRVFRPACDGRYPPEKDKPGKFVIVDGATWPGRPVASWAPVSAATPFEPPSGRGNARLINGNDTGRCPACGCSLKRRINGNLITHKTGPGCALAAAVRPPRTPCWPPGYPSRPG